MSSSSTLLATKLLIPVRRPNLVPRPHLIDRLDRGLHAGHKLTVICASAGYGKTTLVTEWLHNARHPIAWLSLDEQDNDPTRFLAYLIAALRRIDASIGETTEETLHATSLQSPQLPPPEMVLTSLINDLAAISSPFILALDDYHVIHTPAIHQQHAFLLERQPPHITSLGDIPLIVLSHGKMPPMPGLSGEVSREFEQVSQQLHVELAAQSSNGKRIVAEQSGHYIQLDQPGLVIDAIREVVEAARPGPLASQRQLTPGVH